MRITRIVADDWSGSKNLSRKRECDSVDDAIDAVRQLNGHNKTLVILQTNENMSLTVGGGNDGLYVVQIIQGIDERFYTLCNPTAKRDAKFEIVSGGQAGIYPASHCVKIETVLHSVEQFAQTAKPSPDLTWELEE